MRKEEIQRLLNETLRRLVAERAYLVDIQYEENPDPKRIQRQTGYVKDLSDRCGELQRELAGYKKIEEQLAYLDTMERGVDSHSALSSAVSVARNGLEHLGAGQERVFSAFLKEVADLLLRIEQQICLSPDEANGEGDVSDANAI